MKSYREELWFETRQKTEFINITDKVQKAIDKSAIKEGFCLVNPMHITAAVYVNDNESGLIEDFKELLERLVPWDKPYHHNVGEDNAAAHLRRQLMAHQVVLPVTKGKLDFGPWEQVFYAEFDGQRKKRVLIKIIGE